MVEGYSEYNKGDNQEIEDTRKDIGDLNSCEAISSLIGNIWLIKQAALIILVDDIHHNFLAWLYLS